MALQLGLGGNTCKKNSPLFRQAQPGVHTGYPDKIFKTNLVRTNAAVQDDKYCAPVCCPDTPPLDQITPAWDGVETPQVP